MIGACRRRLERHLRRRVINRRKEHVQKLDQVTIDAAADFRHGKSICKWGHQLPASLPIYLGDDRRYSLRDANIVPVYATFWKQIKGVATLARVNEGCRVDDVDAGLSEQVSILRDQPFARTDRTGAGLKVAEEFWEVRGLRGRDDIKENASPRTIIVLNVAQVWRDFSCVTGRRSLRPRAIIIKILPLDELAIQAQEKRRGNIAEERKANFVVGPYEKRAYRQGFRYTVRQRLFETSVQKGRPCPDDREIDRHPGQSLSDLNLQRGSDQRTQ